MTAFLPHRSIHLLYVPTLCCNLSCSYCYLGDQTTEARLAIDAHRAVATLRTALQRLREADVLAFNLSLHGGEVTALPPAVLGELLGMIRDHYRDHADALTALGHKKAYPHIKTNLFKFASLYQLFDQHRVSISASIDLPLALHERHRTTRSGKGWLDKTLDHLRLLARYPHAKKISATLSAEHLADPEALCADIEFLHRDIGLDMNALNLMFAFPSRLNELARAGKPGPLAPATEPQMVELYRFLQARFAGTDLDEGLRRHWFDEFTPSYCTSSQNCGERFFLLQSDGEVWSCVRGQGVEELHYGNLLKEPVIQVLDNGARKVAALHQRFGFDGDCQSCGHLGRCHSGCPAVKLQTARAKSYTCGLQLAMYADRPLLYPTVPEGPEQKREARSYAQQIHPLLTLPGAALANPPPPPAVRLPAELTEPRNTLAALIAADPLLQILYSDQQFELEFAGQRLPLASQLLKVEGVRHIVGSGEALTLQVRRSVLSAGCDERLRNTLYVQLLRDTPVVYGDDRRAKQEHLMTYQRYAETLAPSHLGDDWATLELGPLLDAHAALLLPGVALNLLVTTSALRDHHYAKQKANAFYHVQAVNLPFANFEFYYHAAPTGTEERP